MQQVILLGLAVIHILLCTLVMVACFARESMGELSFMLRCELATREKISNDNAFAKISDERIANLKHVLEYHWGRQIIKILPKKLRHSEFDYIGPIKLEQIYVSDN